jgi:hypothetical protein
MAELGAAAMAMWSAAVTATGGRGPPPSVCERGRRGKAERRRSPSVRERGRRGEAELRRDRNIETERGRGRGRDGGPLPSVLEREPPPSVRQATDTEAACVRPVKGDKERGKGKIILYN